MQLLFLLLLFFAYLSQKTVLIFFFFFNLYANHLLSMQLNKSLLIKALVICQSTFICKIAYLSTLVKVVDNCFQTFNWQLSRLKRATS